MGGGGVVSRNWFLITIIRGTHKGMFRKTLGMALCCVSTYHSTAFKGSYVKLICLAAENFRERNLIPPSNLLRCFVLSENSQNDIFHPSEIKTKRVKFADVTKV